MFKENWIKILSTIDSNCYQKDIYKRTKLSYPTLIKTIKNLQQNKLIEKSNNIIMITKKGSEIREKLNQIEERLKSI